MIYGNHLPEGCSYEMVEEPFAQFDGKSYWKSGDRVKLSVPEGTKFDHWTANRDKGVFISDPWRKDGEHVLQDVTGPVFLYISEESIPEGKEFTVHGVTYRYLNKSDYHYYVSDETRKAKRWVFHSDDDLVFYDGDGEASHITAIVGYDQDKFDDDGVQIHNDLIYPATFEYRNHSRLGIIAPRAFANSTKLKSLYFKDTGNDVYDALVGFDFMIDEEAIKNCPNLEEIKMMEYITKGSDHWEALKPSQVFSIAENAFDNSPKARISCHATEYQNFLSSETWAPFQNRLMVYEATATDFHAEGTAYHMYRSMSNGDGLTNADMDEMMEKNLSMWSADYKNFNAADLLKTNDNARVYYVNVSGVESLDSRDGVMRIYNDPGEYYNYKTIALLRNAIAGNTDVKAIEFYQTNGRSDNSHSDLKMVIQNGAFEGCKNLKELRMFYYVEDGEDHWTCLGPKDVIPGDNIFGIASDEELAKMNKEEWVAEFAKVSKDFRILVSPDRMQEFMDDPNWLPYKEYLEAVEFDPSNTREEYNKYGLNYSYMANPGGILQTSQVVSQDVSWWTAPRIAVEVLLAAVQMGQILKAPTAISRDLVVELVAKEQTKNSIENAGRSVVAAFSTDAFDETFIKNLQTLCGNQYCKDLLGERIVSWQDEFIQWGIVSRQGVVMQGNKATIWRWLCNNYNPTFDAFYVRPSLYDEYLRDDAYTGSSWQRTNNVSRGAFDDDESFCAFASHGAATMDDLALVTSVNGWFNSHQGVRDLTYLGYTTIDSLRTADIQPLTKLEKMVLPTTLKAMEDCLFSNATNLRYVDMHLCDSTNISADLKARGFSRLGIDSLQTLVYLPATYGESDGTNIVVSDGTGFSAEGFRLIDGRDYYVPYAFKTDKVENTRTLAKSTAPYSVCLPYSMPIPNGAKAYKLSGRSTNELIFTQTTETLEALHPYLIWTTEGDASLNTAVADIPANGATTVGKQDDALGYTIRGTLNGISNADAADMRAYILQNDGMWHPVMSDTQEHKAACILPYRAYLLQSSRANARRIGMTLEDATGITQFRTIDSDGSQHIYDLSGRQLSAPTKGVNIINGKKVINN